MPFLRRACDGLDQSAVSVRLCHTHPVPAAAAPVSFFSRAGFPCGCWWWWLQWGGAAGAVVRVLIPLFLFFLSCDPPWALQCRHQVFLPFLHYCHSLSSSRLPPEGAQCCLYVGACCGGLPFPGPHPVKKLSASFFLGYLRLFFLGCLRLFFCGYLRLFGLGFLQRLALLLPSWVVCVFFFWVICVFFCLLALRGQVCGEVQGLGFSWGFGFRVWGLRFRL